MGGKPGSNKKHERTMRIVPERHETLAAKQVPFTVESLSHSMAGYGLCRSLESMIGM
jgi:hypothetical protein